MPHQLTTGDEPLTPIAPITVRIPTLLRQQLAWDASRASRSLNDEIVKRLRSSTLTRQPGCDAIFSALDFPRITRIRSTSSEADRQRLQLLSTHLGAEKLLLAARAHDRHNAVLVVVIWTTDLVLLMDGSALNMARKPRALEIQRLLEHFDDLGLLDQALASNELVPETEHLPPEDAYRVLAKESSTSTFDLPRFLNLLAQDDDVRDLTPYRDRGRVHPTG